MSDITHRSRPILVTVMGWLATLVGLLQIAFGAIVVAKHNDAEFLNGVKDLTSQKALISGISTLVVGLLSVVFAQMLLRGSRIARDLIGLVQIAQIGFGIYTIVSLDSQYHASAYGGIGGAVVVLYFLFGTEKSKAFFAKH